MLGGPLIKSLYYGSGPSVESRSRVVTVATRLGATTFELWHQVAAIFFL